MSGFQDEFDKTQEEMGGSDYFKFKEGENKIRVLTQPVKKLSRWGHGICYEGAAYCTPEALDASYAEALEEAKKAGKDISKVARPQLSLKWAVWAIDRATGKIVIAELTNTMARTIREWMDGDDYGFKQFPMPYDMTVSAKGAGKTTVKYTVTAARKNTDLTEEELTELSKQTPIDQIIEKMMAKKRDADGVEAPAGEEEIQAGDGTEDDEINPEDVAF